MPYFDYNRTPIEIILACQERSHEIYAFKRNTNIYRNLDLLAFFDETDLLRIDQLTPRMQELKADDNYSEAFEAKRAGELIRWGMDHGVLVHEIVDRVAAWRIIDREMQYLLVGPAARQREIRIRGLKDPVERAEANKLFNRELKRRDKARAKVVAGLRSSMAFDLGVIADLSPDLVLSDDLQRFRFAGQETTYVMARLLLVDVDDQNIEDVSRSVAAVARELERAALKAEQAAWKVKRETPTIPDDDADAMGSIGF